MFYPLTPCFKLTTIVTAILSLYPFAVNAEAVVDSSWGRHTETLTGQMTIPQTLGKLSGSNLFHSFEKFNIKTGESATFTTSTSSIANVITRVSGNESSSINGLLKLQALEGGKPNFFLVNPNGVTFGAGAQIDVPGAFHVSTANHLQFADGTQFKAGNGPDNTLTIASPEAFGFLGNNAKVRIENLSSTPSPLPIELNHALMAENIFAWYKFIGPDAFHFSGSLFDITASNIEIINSKMSAPFAAVRLAAVGNTASTVDLSLGANRNLVGSIDVQGSYINGSVIGRPMYIQAGIIFLNYSILNNAVYSSVLNGFNAVKSDDMSIHLDANNIIGNWIGIHSFGATDGNMGSILINADKVSFKEARITSEIFAKPGQKAIGGNVEVNASEITLNQRTSLSALSNDIHQSSPTKLGSVKLNGSKEIIVSNESGIIVTPWTANTDFGYYETDPGSIFITTPKLSLLGNSYIFTTPFVNSKVGYIFINSLSASTVPVPMPLTITGDGTGFITTSTTGLSRSGTIEIFGSDVNINNINFTNDVILVDEIFTTSFGKTLPQFVIDYLRRIPYQPLEFGRAGIIYVIASESLNLINSTLSSSTKANSGAGFIILKGKDILLDNTAITSRPYLNATGNGGLITIAAQESINIQNHSLVSTEASTQGAAGSINIGAQSITIDQSEISSASKKNTTGLTGQIWMASSESLSLKNNSLINTTNEGNSTLGIYPLNLINIESPKLSLENNSKITSASNGNITAGNIDIKSTNLFSTSLEITSDSTGVIDSSTSNKGNAGAITLASSGNLLLKGLTVSSNTSGSGNAGQINVMSNGAGSGIATSQANILSNALTGSTGYAGAIEFHSPGAVNLNGSVISTNTAGIGNAGSINFNTGSVNLLQTQVLSQANKGSSGNAGGINFVSLGNMTVLNGSDISSNTAGSGKAGNISISAVSLLVDPSQIASGATQGSSGQTGNIIIDTTDTLTVTDNSSINIRNDATVSDPSTISASTLSLNAPNIYISNNSQITSASTGNVNASHIVVNAGNQLTLQDASITTTAQDGNGGNITINGGHMMKLSNSEISTSVLGDKGNGGAIDITADFLIMEHGFIQANTAADNASGGTVFIDTNALIANNGNLLLGGNTPIKFSNDSFNNINVIQSAAPDGLSGTITVIGPQIDTTSLSKLGPEAIDTKAFSQDICRIGSGSSFTRSNVKTNFSQTPRISRANTLVNTPLKTTGL